MRAPWFIAALSLSACSGEDKPKDVASADTDRTDTAQDDTARVDAPDTASADTPAETTPSDANADTGQADAPLVPPEPLPPIQVVREFGCDEAAMGAAGDIAPVAGMEGATLAVRPGTEPCRFELVLRRPGTDPIPLSGATRGGYLLAVAGKAPSGRIVVCASNIDHVADSASGDPTAVARRIERVDIECTIGDGTTFPPLARLIETDGTYAAWALGLEQSDETPGRYRLSWIRDFSFQFANLNNNGRPPTDGIYATTFDVAADGSWTVLDTTRISDVVSPQDIVQGEWVPTDEEKEAYAEFMDFDDGTCGPPAGCELPPEQ